MKLKPEALTGHLNQTLLALYYVSGDEPLLIQEAIANIAQTAQQQHFSERYSFIADANFDSDALQNLTHSGSLFGDRKRIEIKIPGKMPSELAEWITSLCERPLEDVIVIISSGKLDAASQKTAWYKAIDDIGAHIAIWPIEAHQLNGWLSARARRMSLSLEPAALALLSECVEGNLLAAAQWLEKLSLQAPNTPVTAAMMEQVLEDSSRYDVFELLAYTLRGNGNKAWHILQKLALEEDTTVIVWALAKEIRTVYQLQQQKSQVPLSVLFQQLHIWPKRQGDFEAALRRLSADRCLNALQQLAQIDSMIKGGIEGDPWMALANLVHTLCLSLNQNPVKMATHQL